MTIRHCLCSSFYSLQPLVNFARLRRPLSAITKNQPHWLAFPTSGSALIRLTTPFSFAYPTFPYSSLFSLVYSNSKYL